MFSSAFFSPRMSRRVCRGSPKGLSQRSHLFRRPARQRSPLKGLHGKISGHLLRELLGHTLLQPRDQAALRPAGCYRWVRRTVYFERTLNPAQPPRCLCFPLCLVLTLQLLITALPTGASAKLAICVRCDPQSR